MGVAVVFSSGQKGVEFFLGGCRPQGEAWHMVCFAAQS